MPLAGVRPANRDKGATCQHARAVIGLRGAIRELHMRPSIAWDRVQREEIAAVTIRGHLPARNLPGPHRRERALEVRVVERRDTQPLVRRHGPEARVVAALVRVRVGGETAEVAHAEEIAAHVVRRAARRVHRVEVEPLG